MRVIGMTGGVGAGKSKVLSYIQGKYHCRVVYADQAAHQLIRRGQPCYRGVIELLGQGVLAPDLSIDKAKMADLIFRKESLLARVNQLIHPAVKTYITNLINEEKDKDELDFLFIEAALLIEDGYTQIVDELWYIYADEKTRSERLRDSRAYSEDKIAGILANQLPDEAFRKHCSVVIDNGADLEETYSQIDRKLEEYL